MKCAAIFLFLSCLIVTAGGQTKPCNLTVKDSPSIRGIKLGMTKNQFSQRIDRSSVGNFVFLYKDDLEKLSDFEDVVELNAIFNSQNILDSFVIKYDQNAVSWSNGKEFTRNLSDNFKLPFAAWSYFSTENREATLSCKDFYMEIYAPINQILVKSLAPEGQSRQPTVTETTPQKAFKP